MGRSFFGLVVALLLWANWQAPALPTSGPAAQQVVWRVGGLTDPRQAVSLDQRLRTLDGVIACQLDHTTQLAVVSFNPEQISEGDVRRALAAGGAYVVSRPSFAVTETAGAVELSAPVSEIFFSALNRLRLALNVRRLFAPGV